MPLQENWIPQDPQHLTVSISWLSEGLAWRLWTTVLAAALARALGGTSPAACLPTSLLQGSQFQACMASQWMPLIIRLTGVENGTSWK